MPVSSELLRITLEVMGGRCGPVGVVKAKDTILTNIMDVARHIEDKSEIP